jgi:hypothetical protein
MVTPMEASARVAGAPILGRSPAAIYMPTIAGRRVDRTYRVATTRRYGMAYKQSETSPVVLV